MRARERRVGTLFSELSAFTRATDARPLIYADANLPAPAVRDMRTRFSWDVTHVIDDPRWRRATDVAHFHRARQLRRTLVSLDHDYFDDRRFPPAESGGVVVLSAPDGAALTRLLVDLDALLRLSARTPGALDQPLRGRKLHLFPGWTEYA